MLLLCDTAHAPLSQAVRAQRQAKHAIAIETGILHYVQSMRGTLNANMNCRSYIRATCAICIHANNDNMLDELSRRLCLRKRLTAPGQLPAVCMHASILTVLQKTALRRCTSKQHASNVLTLMLYIRRYPFPFTRGCIYDTTDVQHHEKYCGALCFICRVPDASAHVQLRSAASSLQTWVCRACNKFQTASMVSDLPAEICISYHDVNMSCLR